MKLQISKNTKKIILGGFGAALAIGLGLSLLIHKLGAIIRGLGGVFGLGQDTETFAVIFDQLRTAKVDLPSWLLLILCMILVWGIMRYFKLISPKKANKKVVYGIGILFGILWIFMAVVLISILTLWLTDVNKVRIGIVVQFLYSALQHGVF